MSILKLVTRLVHKGLFPGLSHSRGKYPQPYCHSNTKPSVTESPKGNPTEIPDNGFRSQTPESEYPPPTQRSSAASPRTGLASGKLPTRRRTFHLCRQECYYCCRVRAGIPNIYSRFYLGTLVVYWVTSSVAHTIYLNNSTNHSDIQPYFYTCMYNLSMGIQPYFYMYNLSMGIQPYFYICIICQWGSSHTSIYV